MKLLKLKDVTDQTLLVFIQDSSSVTGAGLTGLVYSDLTSRYARVEDDNDVVVSTITMATLSALTDAHSDGGFLEVDSTNMPGWYRFDIPDGAFATGASSVGISLIDAATNNIAQSTIEIQLVNVNLTDGVRFGLTALPNAASGASGGLVTGDGSVTFTAGVGNRPAVDVLGISGDTTAADNAESFFDGTGYAGTNNVIPSVTTVTGNVDGSVGSVSGAVGSVTGNVGGNVVGTVASVVGAVGSVTAQVTADVTSISGDSIAADNAESFFDGTGYAGTNNVIPSVTTVTGNVNGSVGSVSGAVGSVTGNVGGNVVGSVDSVTGAVGSVTGNVGGNVTGSVGSIATGGITALSIATDAIDADAIAADAVTEIQSGLATSSSITAIDGKIDTIDTNVDTALTNIATIDGIVDSILADTGTDGVIVATNNDKTGYSLAASQLFIKKNVAFSNFCFVMTDSTTHAPSTGLTVAGQVSLDGAAFSSLTNSITEVASGLYKVSLVQAETNAQMITLRFTATGADDRLISFVTQA